MTFVMKSMMNINIVNIFIVTSLIIANDESKSNPFLVCILKFSRIDDVNFDVAIDSILCKVNVQFTFYSFRFDKENWFQNVRMG